MVATEGHQNLTVGAAGLGSAGGSGGLLLLRLPGTAARSGVLSSVTVRRWSSTSLAGELAGSRPGWWQGTPGAPGGLSPPRTVVHALFVLPCSLQPSNAGCIRIWLLTWWQGGEKLKQVSSLGSFSYHSTRYLGAALCHHHPMGYHSLLPIFLVHTWFDATFKNSSEIWKSLSKSHILTFLFT